MIDATPARLLRNHLAQKRQLWQRALLVIGVLLFSGAGPSVASERQLTLVSLLLLGLGAVMTFLRWPPVGLIVAALAGMVVPYAGPSGLNATMILVALLLGLWLLDMMVRQRQIRLAPSRAVWPLLAFVVVACLSFVGGQLPWFRFAHQAPLGAQLGGLSIVVLSAGVFLLEANQVRDLVWLRRLTWAFLALATVSFVGRSLLPSLGLPTRDLFQPVGSAFFVWLVTMAFSQAIFNRELPVGWRLALGVLVLLVLYHLMTAKFNDKSGWLPPLVGVAAMIGFRSWRAGVALVLVVALSGSYLLAQLIGSDAYSLSTRLDAWLIMASLIQSSPIWGLGFANYYWYTPLLPIRGYAVSFNSHNNYIDLLAQTGLVGLVCFLWFLLEVGGLTWRLRERVPDGFARAYVLGAWGGLVGIVVAGMLGDWILPFFYNIGMNGFKSSMLTWLFLGGLVSLEHMVFREKRPMALAPKTATTDRH